MAKQIYIDANGNEIEISGTINNAEILPISASDPTPTAQALGNKPTNTSANPYLKTVFSSNITKTVGAGADVAVLGSDIDLAQPGYTPIAICSMYSTSPSIVFRSFDCRIVSGSSVFCVLHNITNASANATVNFVILFMRNSN